MKILILLTVAALSICAKDSFAHTDNVFECDKAKSTSAIQQCLKKQLELAQTRLQTAYDALDDQFDDKEQRTELKELQQTWLRYRDQECMWEGEQATSPGLKGINELSCMVRVSNDRADLLEITYMDVDPSITRDYADTSRWKNLLSSDHTDIMWDLKNVEMVDLTCDDTAEIIVQGVKYNETDMYEIAAQPLFEKQEVVAVITNPDIGSTSAEIFAFDVIDEVNNNAPQNLICDSKVKLSFATNKILTEDEQEVKSCDSKITMSLAKCEDRHISWDGKKFTLQDRTFGDEEKIEKE